ncbi:MAG TPA: glycosyl hydrolase family 28 protein [Bryobacteraceae bacterium]
MTDRRTFLRAAGWGLVAAPFAKSAVALNVREFGAKGDGVAKDTPAIQAAVDRCSVLGGGEVGVSAGNYLTGAIALRSGVVLRLDRDAVITGTPDFADYPVTQVRWEGKWIPGHVGLIYALDAERIGVVGPGKIVGNPAVGGRPTAVSPLRHPALIETINCREIRFEDFSTEYRLMWCIHPTLCENISIKNLTIRSTGGNGDGIDIDSCKHVRIDGCDIATGDDCIAIKSGRGSEAWAVGKDTEDVVISNCTFADSIFACIGIGSETSGGIRGVRIEKCKFTHAQTFAIYIKSRVGRGAFIEDVSVDDVDASGMVQGFLRVNSLSSGLQDEAPVAGLEGVPRLRNFSFTKIRVKDCPWLADVTGVHPQKPLEGFVFSDVSGTAAKGISLANVRGARIEGVKVTGISGPVVGVSNATGIGLEGAATIEGPKVPELVVGAGEYRLR